MKAGRHYVVMEQANKRMKVGFGITDYTTPILFLPKDTYNEILDYIDNPQDLHR